ncbi:MAG: hypothetical protein WC944_11115 [Candidatus Cloacimonadaceae bacterium]
MQNLIVRRGFPKRAAAEDGPSFEQQFGILTNAVIADKFPQLDKSRLAFQLLEKSEDNSEACGVAIYLIGSSVLFIPAVFKNNKLRTGDMFFNPKTQQFLPLSDPWIADAKASGVNEAGESVEPDFIGNLDSSKGQTIRSLTDPLIKSAAFEILDLLHSVPNMERRVSGTSLLDAVISFGKTASESLLDNMIKDTNFLNAALTFYSGDELDTFAKQASAMAEPLQEIELILPLDKTARELSEQELKVLYRDGFFIRKHAADDTPAPSVIRSKKLNTMFGAINKSGKHSMLQMNGDIKELLVLSVLDTGGFKAFTGRRGVSDVPVGAMALIEQFEPFKPEMLDGIGTAITSRTIKDIPEGAFMIYPTGECARFGVYGCRRTSEGDGWTNGTTIVSVSENAEMKRPLATSTALILPQGTKIVMPEGHNQDGTYDNSTRRDVPSNVPIAYVTLSTLDSFLLEYCKKQYNKARIYSNGQEFVINGDKNTNESPLSIKEAAMTLVKHYNVEPAMAKVMLKEANNGASYNNPRSSTYFITKTARDWEDAPIGKNMIEDKEAEIRAVELPTILEDPAQLSQAVTTAAQQGIKEVFDVTALKLIVRQNRFFDEISGDIPLFMRVLDSLCRKLFQFYWHTDRMEEKYGMVKMKALEESLKCTLDSLSELTIFFKVRTVDGSGITGDSAGELMSGNMG